MISGLSLPRLVRLAVVLVVLGGLLTGCDASLDSARYPQSLKYPLRHDLLVKKEPAETAGLKYPPPGHLDEDIIEASKQPGAITFDPTTLSSAGRSELKKTLDKVFGTPASPTVALESDAIAALKLDNRTLRKGSIHYRRHCVHCHGLAGDGRGPTGPWVHPHPRDYRSGIFKFTSISPDLASFKPRRADLMRTLRKGIEGTSMPAFALLPEQEREELASYVIHLSLRGETEYQTLIGLLEAKNTSPEEGLIEKTISDPESGLALLFLSQWQEADKSINIPIPYPDTLKEPAADATPEEKEKHKANLLGSVKRGYDLFIGRAACISCHHDFGRQARARYDAWASVIRPANLTVGVYRGGRRPLDIYWRLTKGINGAGMSGLPPAVKKEETWDLVNFVQALPYPAMLPAEVKQKIYGIPATPRKEIASVGHP